MDHVGVCFSKLPCHYLIRGYYSGGWLRLKYRPCRCGCRCNAKSVIWWRKGLVPRSLYPPWLPFAPLNLCSPSLYLTPTCVQCFPPTLLYLDPRFPETALVPPRDCRRLVSPPKLLLRMIDRACIFVVLWVGWARYIYSILCANFQVGTVRFIQLRSTA